LRHIVSLLVENQFGVLARVAGTFAARALNIESLSVAQTVDPEISSMTIVATGNSSIVEQVVKQLNKLVNVVEVKDLEEGSYMCREMAIVEVSADENERGEILNLAQDFGGD
jgi:acetolactate synthase I/III small subunit